MRIFQARPQGQRHRPRRAPLGQGHDIARARQKRASLGHDDFERALLSLDKGPRLRQVSQVRWRPRGAGFYYALGNDVSICNTKGDERAFRICACSFPVSTFLKIDCQVV